jgi:hypothetical protein
MKAIARRSQSDVARLAVIAPIKSCIQLNHSATGWRTTGSGINRQLTARSDRGNSNR